MSEKVKIFLEYIVNSSPRILYPYLIEPNALAQWLADEVRLKDSNYEFIWDDEVHKAKLIAGKDMRTVRYKWVEDEPYFFELEIVQDELTNDVALTITDYVKEDNLEDRKKIWDNSIEYLQSALGA
ncbi:hypothetical protein J5U18_03105 [Sphingobacteriaceae bacterium WQ 2009]|uniref:START-like domain-containing protein n=1 Tax=Rhinopithecimicrobium faecis TaxID=2820698 RepID=A0A8T4H681_9SPHI|nr:hypothetical protein [Sphingobacteriaceae bacterium WQ 2009]